MGEAIDDRIAEGFAEGWVSAASLATGASFAHAVRVLGDRPIGVHLQGRDPADWARQLARVRAEGIEPTHLDTHEHVHWLDPGPFLHFARASGVRCVRAPGTFGRRGQPALRGSVQRLLFLGRAVGLVTPDDFANPTALRCSRRALRGVIELMFHPANPHDPRYAEEEGWIRAGRPGIAAHRVVGWRELLA
jgi:hypothetical protein